MLFFYRTFLFFGLFLALLPPSLRAIDPGRDFSGKWILDDRASKPGNLAFHAERSLDIAQTNDLIRCTAGTAQWSYSLTGKETRYRIAHEERNSMVKWEGDALLINTLVSGQSNYTIMDRWRLGGDSSTLTINRQIVQATGQSDGILIYRHELPPVPKTPAAETPAAPRTAERSNSETPAEAGIAERPTAKAPPRRPESSAAAGAVVPAGTRIPLVFLNDIDTKHSREGDRVYLQTSFPVVVAGRVIIPKGSAVTGIVTQVKRPGRVSGKGELFLRFDSLTLPNGVTRDFRSRPGSADAGANGQVDPKEGKVTGEGNRGGDARKVGTTAGAGASVGVITGGIAGHAGQGAAIGGASGAAAGLASVLLGRGPDASLHRGTVMEMILDRDLAYSEHDLAR